MLKLNDPPTRFRVLVLLFTAASLGLFGLGLTSPEDWMDLEEFGPFQNIQNLVLGGTFLFNLWAFLGRKGEGRAFFGFLLFFSFFLFWREMDLDQEFWKVRLFSFTYFSKGAAKMPFYRKVLLGGTAFTILGLWLGYVLFKWKTIYLEIRSRFQPEPFFWGLGAIALMGLAQLWDRAILIQRHFHLAIVKDSRDPYCEEAMEFAGEIAFFLMLTSFFFLRPMDLRQSWAPFRAWFGSAVGRRFLLFFRIFGTIFGLALLLGASASIYFFLSKAWPVELLLDFTGDTPRFLLELGEIRWTHVAVLGLGMVLGMALTLFCIFIRLLLKRRLAVWPFVGAVIAAGSLPFFFLEPTRSFQVRMEARTRAPLAADEVVALAGRLEPAIVLNRFPDELRGRLKIHPAEDITGYVLERLPSIRAPLFPPGRSGRIECRMVLGGKKHLDSWRMHTFLEQFAGFFSVEVLELARKKGTVPKSWVEGFLDPTDPRLCPAFPWSLREKILGKGERTCTGGVDEQDKAGTGWR